MAGTRKPPESSNIKPRKPATTPEAREQQLIALAVDVVEERLMNRTASAQETTFYLKLASSRERLEQEKIRKEIKLLDIKADAVESGKQIAELYGNALAAMRKYQGQDDIEMLDD